MVKGGEVLTILYERMQSLSGDPAARTLYGALLRAAGAPYVTMVRVWVTTGRLVDPCEELCVKESKFINRGMIELDYTDEYWERRYTVRMTGIYGSAAVIGRCTDLSCHTATRRFDAGGALEAAPSGRAPAAVGRRAVAWWGMHTATVGGLEA